MKHRPWVLETLVLVTACAPTRDAGGRLDFQPERFASESGDSVAGEIAFLNVPRNYADPSLGTLRLAVARLRSAGSVPGSPILYLSGGPGAWGIHPERMPLLDALRAHGDVYTFDQRGTGRSTPVLSCPTQSELPARELESAPIGVPDSWDEHVKLMIDLQVLAFASDTTRVSAFKLSRDVSGRTFPESGVDTGFHRASHHGEREQRITQFSEINKYHVSKTASRRASDGR